jgi:hypothetical protein
MMPRRRRDGQDDGRRPYRVMFKVTTCARIFGDHWHALAVSASIITCPCPVSMSHTEGREGILGPTTKGVWKMIAALFAAFLLGQVSAKNGETMVVTPKQGDRLQVHAPFGSLVPAMENRDAAIE